MGSAIQVWYTSAVEIASLARSLQSAMLSWQLTSHLCGHICVSDTGNKHALQLELNILIMRKALSGPFTFTP